MQVVCLLRVRSGGSRSPISEHVVQLFVSTNGPAAGCGHGFPRGRSRCNRVEITCFCCTFYSAQNQTFNCEPGAPRNNKSPLLSTGIGEIDPFSGNYSSYAATVGRDFCG